MRGSWHMDPTYGPLTDVFRVSFWDGEPPRLQAKPSGGRSAGNADVERSKRFGRVRELPGQLKAGGSASGVYAPRTSASADAAREALAFRRGRITWRHPDAVPEPSTTPRPASHS